MYPLRNASAFSLGWDESHLPKERHPPLQQRGGNLLTLTLALLAVGCTHTQLRWSTVKQADTLSDIYQQQVMDNLAMFVHDYNALPHFAYPNSGASIVDDRGSVGVGSFNAFRISTGGAATRGLQQTWQLTPVTDPDKLALMRCAYQVAVRNCGDGLVSEKCPDCDARFNDFGAQDRETCLESHCWFCVGCKRDVPKCCKCNYVGHYCGVYVWVPPGPGRAELARLTMAILDYAVHDAPESRKKQVVYYLKEDGTAATYETAATVVTANVSVNDHLGDLLKQPYAGDLTEIETQLHPAQSEKNRLTMEELALLRERFNELKVEPETGVDALGNRLDEAGPWSLSHTLADWQTQIDSLNTRIQVLRADNPAIVSSDDIIIRERQMAGQRVAAAQEVSHRSDSP